MVLAQSDLTPDFYHAIDDRVGDSLQLPIEGTRVDADNIVQSNLRFLADRSKMLNPARNQLMPDMEAGCPLAKSIMAVGLTRSCARDPDATVGS